ncbi:MAG: energy transducer TonB [Myxococcota bacterium]
MRRRTFITALAVSLALHGAILLGLRLFRGPGGTTRPQAPPPLEVQLIRPPPVTEAPPLEPEPPEKDDRSQKPLPVREPEPPPMTATAERSDTAPEPAPPEPTPGTAEPQGPSTAPNSLVRRPNLFAPEAIARGATRVEPKTPKDENPVQRMLDSQRFGRRHGPRQSAAVKELSVRLDSWFNPPAETIRATGKAERRSFARRLGNYLKSPPRDDIAIDSEHLDPDGASDLRADRGGWLCLSGCSGSNLHSKLVALIEIDHTQTPLAAKVIVSSGFRDYDRAALRAVEDFAQSPSSQIPIDAAATHWTFESGVYRYRRDELILDPQFEPLGRRIDETFAYVYSLDTRIRMVAVAENSPAER